MTEFFDGPETEHSRRAFDRVCRTEHEVDGILVLDVRFEGEHGLREALEQFVDVGEEVLEHFGIEVGCLTLDVTAEVGAIEIVERELKVRDDFEHLLKKNGR